MGIVQQCAKDEVPTNENSQITEISALKSKLGLRWCSGQTTRLSSLRFRVRSPVRSS